MIRFTEAEHFLKLHSNREDKEHLLYIKDDAIDYFEGDKSGSTWIYFRGGNAVNVFESPEEISTMLKQNKGSISLT